MSERVIVFLLSSTFLLVMVNNAIGVLLAWSLVRAVREVDPAKRRELTAPARFPVGYSWVNPWKLAAFVKAGDSLGSPAVASKLIAYRRVVKSSRVCLFIYLIGAFVLFMMMK